MAIRRKSPGYRSSTPTSQNALQPGGISFCNNHSAHMTACIELSNWAASDFAGSPGTILHSTL